MRVVSVLPSATEIVFALGHGDELVGRSAECDYPAAVLDRPIVMRPKTVDSERPSGEIDARVRAGRGAGESLYTLDVDRLRALRPDLLLTQDLCGVCSVTDREVEQACAVAGIHPTIVSLVPRTLEEVWRSVETVGAALGDEAGGRRLATELRRRSEPPPRRDRRSVAVVEWLDPPILAGLWTPEIVRAAGGEPLGPAVGEPGERTRWDRLAARPPQVLVLSPCSFSVARSRRELKDPALAAQVASVHAVGGTFVADEAYFSRPGPRLAEGIEMLRALLRDGHPRGPMPVDRWSPSAVEASA